jgi:hypothetical protein
MSYFICVGFARFVVYHPILVYRDSKQSATCMGFGKQPALASARAPSRLVAILKVSRAVAYLSCCSQLGALLATMALIVLLSPNNLGPLVQPSSPRSRARLLRPIYFCFIIHALLQRVINLPK